MIEKKITANELLQVVESVMAETLSPHSQGVLIAKDFEESEIEYCIVGGVALGVYNYKRFTEDLDILVSKKTEKLIDEHLVGNGYTKRPGSIRNLYYHTMTGKIPVDIIIEGDNKSGFVVPNPRDVRVKLTGAWFLSLKALITMKLSTSRPEDKQDVAKLISVNDLTDKWAEENLNSELAVEFNNLKPSSH